MKSRPLLVYQKVEITVMSRELKTSEPQMPSGCGCVWAFRPESLSSIWDGKEGHYQKLIYEVPRVAKKRTKKR